MKSVSATAEALDFLARLPHAVHNLVAFSPDGRGRPVGAITRPAGHPDLADFVTRHNGRSNLYYSLNEPRPDAPDAKLSKRDIRRLHFVAVDLDARPAQGRTKDDVRRTATALADDMLADVTATYAVDTGGGYQVLWQLAEPLPAEAAEAVEAQGRGLALTLDADATQNVDRILRLPGTLNIPTAKKAAAGRKPAPATLLLAEGEPVPLDALRAIAQPVHTAPGDAGRGAYDGPLQWPPPHDRLEDLPGGLLAKLEALRQRDATFAARFDNGDTTGLQDQSRDGLDMSIIARMKRAGFSADETLQVSWLCEHGKVQDMDERYFRRTFGHTTAEPLAPAAEDFDDVEPPPGDEPAPKPKRPPLHFDLYASAAEVTSQPYLIKGLLDQGAMSVIYGESNTGKTFLAMDIAHAVASGRDWMGRRTVGGGVLYIAAEAGRSARRRLAALQRHYNDREASVHLALVACPVDLLNANADTPRIIDMVKEAEAAMGVPVRLIVIDTLSRAIAGGNENGPEDMGAFVRNVDRIRSASGAHIAVVHHSGKDRARGARGHSLLRAATDTELEVEVQGGAGAGNGAARTVTAKKQRDMDMGAPVAFGLQRIVLGVDDDGDEVSSCVVVPGLAVTAAADMPQIGLDDGKKPAEFFKLLWAAGTERGDGKREVGWDQARCIFAWGLRDTKWRQEIGLPEIKLSEITDFAVSAELTHHPDLKGKMRAFYNLLDAMVSGGVLEKHEDKPLILLDVSPVSNSPTHRE